MITDLVHVYFTYLGLGTVLLGVPAAAYWRFAK